jgi:hypothetical protein
MKETTEQRPWLPTSNDGPPPKLPLAAMLQGSVTNTRTTDADPGSFPRNNALALQQASLFLAGRLAEHFGAFAQWTYDGIAHHSSVDNVDVRVAGQLKHEDLDVSYGLTVNNNPTVSDVYNSTPAWGFPFASSRVAVVPNASTLIDGGLAAQVAGVGVYSMWNKTIYAEVAGYRTANEWLSVLRAGTDKTIDAILQGNAPYWRVALQHVWNEGEQMVMFGAYGVDARKFPDSLDPVGASDRFRDIGVDAQYQFVADRHRFSAQLNSIRERQRLNGTFVAGGSTNPTNTLQTFRGKATYYFNEKYGATLSYFRTTGSTDNGLYNTGQPITGSAAGSPNSSGYIFEVDWLPRRDMRLALQYTAYREFNGAGSNYDGFGRNAKDNDALYCVAWLMF